MSVFAIPFSRRKVLQVLTASGASAFLGGCGASGGAEASVESTTQPQSPDVPVGEYHVDTISPISTQETRALLTFLKNFRDDGSIVGSQVKWLDSEQGPRMLNAIAGDYPSLYGYELAWVRVSSGQDWNGENRSAVKADIESKFASGKIISLVDHMPNFLTGGNWYDKNNKCMREIGPGGSLNEAFVAYLDGMIGFIDSLNEAGKKVPVLLRLFHEAMLPSFWWSNWSIDGTQNPYQTVDGYVTNDEYVASYRFAVDYLKARLSNVLFVYCQGTPNGGAFPYTGMSPDWYQATFPGADYCDIISVDCYANGATPFAGNFSHRWLVASYDACASLAASNDKPFALAEVGFKYSAQRWGEDPAELGGFWNDVFLTQLWRRPIRPKYLMFWTDEYGPSSTARTSTSALAMLQDPRMRLASSINAKDVYGSA